MHSTAIVKIAVSQAKIETNELIATVKPKPSLIDPDLLGVGAFGRVRKITWENIIVAEKKSSWENEKEKKIAKNERMKLIHLSKDKEICPYIIKLLAYKKDSDSSTLLLEYMNAGNFEQYLETHNENLNYDIAYKMMGDVTKALAYLHTRDLAHFDIKPSNILLNQEAVGYTAKLGDLGFCKRVISPIIYDCGSPLFCPPEIFLRNPASTPCDIYSFGMTLVQVMNGIHYTENMFATTKDFMNFIIRGERPLLLEGGPKKIQHIIFVCWQANQALRPTAGQLVTTFNASITLLDDELEKLKNDNYFFSTFISFLNLTLENITTIHTAKLSLLQKQATILTEKYQHATHIEIKNQIKHLIQEIILHFCIKCTAYNNSFVGLFKPRFHPINFINANFHKHRFTRGLGLILKKILDDEALHTWLDECCQIHTRNTLSEQYRILSDLVNPNNLPPLEIQQLSAKP